MQLESFRVFRDLVDSKSFSKAAKLNNITQSAVSQQVRNMENRLRVSLLERSSKRFALTREGELLYQTCKELVSLYEGLLHQFEEIKDVVAGNIKVATVYSIGLHQLPFYLKKFLKEFPEVNVHVEYRRANQIYDEVLSGAYDIGLVAFPDQRKGLKTEIFQKDRLVAICAPQHPMAEYSEVDVKMIAHYKFVGFESDLPTRQAIDEILSQAGQTVKPLMEFDNIETVKQAVEINAGVSIVPQASVEKEISAGSLAAVNLKGEAHYRPLGFVYKSVRALPPAMKQFIDILINPRIKE